MLGLNNLKIIKGSESGITLIKLVIDLLSDFLVLTVSHFYHECFNNIKGDSTNLNHDIGKQIIFDESCY